MINDFGMQRYISASLYADEGTSWKRGRNDIHVMKSSLQIVESWSYNWSFRVSVAKSCYVLFTRKKAPFNTDLFLYGKPLERVSELKTIFK